jgi:hypothetical protein
MMIQATGKVAASVIEGLKASPLALPLVIVNLLALGLVAFTLQKISDRSEARDVLISKLAQECKS